MAQQLNIEGHENRSSRAIMAMSDVLIEAKGANGHTFLTWEALKNDTLSYLNATGKL